MTTYVNNTVMSSENQKKKTIISSIISIMLYCWTLFEPELAPTKKYAYDYSSIKI